MGVLFEPSTAQAEREVDRYSAAEQAQFKEQFTRKQRRRWWLQPLSFLGLMVTLGFVAGGSYWLATEVLGSEIWAAVFIMPTALALAIGREMWLIRRCPACRTEVDHTVGSYCPCCGARALQRVNERWHCSECGVELKWNLWIRSRPRRFRVRTCSTCGVKLHDEGV